MVSWTPSKLLNAMICSDFIILAYSISGKNGICLGILKCIAILAFVCCSSALPPWAIEPHYIHLVETFVQSIFHFNMLVCQEGFQKVEEPIHDQPSVLLQLQPHKQQTVLFF